MDRADLRANRLAGLRVQLRVVGAKRRGVGVALRVDCGRLLLVDRGELRLGLLARAGVHGEIREPHLDRQARRRVLLRQAQREVGLVLLQLLGFGAILLRRLRLQLARQSTSWRRCLAR